MAKTTKSSGKASPASSVQSNSSTPEENQPRKFGWIPLWGWMLLFLVPLLVSEYMFFRVDRWFNIIAFPLAWFGFWYIMLRRSGSVIFKRRKDK
jgi:hypothetical protein